MKFAALTSIFALVGVVFASPAPLERRASATSLINDIQMVTTESENLQAVCSGINLVNAIFQGPSIASGLAQIASDATNAITDATAPPTNPFDDETARQIVVALDTFVAVHQQLLSTLIGKHGILSLFPFTQPIAVALRAIEAAVDALAFALINLIPTQANQAMTQKGMLDTSLALAVQTYSS